MSSSPDIPAQEKKGLSLSGSENQLHRALSDKDPRIGKMYLGSLMALADESNPDRLPLAAHDLRELMEKMPEYMDVKISKPSLRGDLQPLSDEWKKIKAEKDSAKCAKLQEGFLKKLDEFFSRFEMVHPKRKAQTQKALKKLQSVDRYLPAPLEALEFSEWDLIQDYFLAVAHHRKESSVEEFKGWKAALEKFLLDRLCPRTFADQKEILSMIQEGERDAKP